MVSRLCPGGVAIFCLSYVLFGFCWYRGGTLVVFRLCLGFVSVVSWWYVVSRVCLVCVLVISLLFFPYFLVKFQEITHVCSHEISIFVDENPSASIPNFTIGIFGIVHHI